MTNHTTKFENKIKNKDMEKNTQKKKKKKNGRKQKETEKENIVTRRGDKRSGGTCDGNNFASFDKMIPRQDTDLTLRCALRLHSGLPPAPPNFNVDISFGSS